MDEPNVAPEASRPAANQALDDACLSDALIESLSACAPEAIPIATARHLASCHRCQERALFGASRARRTKPARPPSLRRAFGLVGLVLAALALFFYSVLQLAGFFG